AGAARSSVGTSGPLVRTSGPLVPTRPPALAPGARVRIFRAGVISCSLSRPVRLENGPGGDGTSRRAERIGPTLPVDAARLHRLRRDGRPGPRGRRLLWLADHRPPPPPRPPGVRHHHPPHRRRP